MTRQDRSRSASSFAQRLTPLIAAAGVTPVPTTLLRYQSLLDLSPQAVLLICWVLSKKWGPEWPYLSIDEVAAGVGCARRRVQVWKQELIARGFLRAIPRYVPGLGRRADTWDLSGLFAALESLYMQEQSQAALDKVRNDLPPPSFPLGVSILSTQSTHRRAVFSTPRRAESSTSRRAQNDAPVMTDPASPAVPDAAQEKEDLAKNPNRRARATKQPTGTRSDDKASPATSKTRSTSPPRDPQAVLERLMREDPEQAEQLRRLGEEVRRRRRLEGLSEGGRA